MIVLCRCLCIKSHGSFPRVEITN